MRICYEFTLTVDRMPTDDEVDALFDLDEGDSTPEGGPSGAVVYVYREDTSLAAAIASGLRSVESVGLRVTGARSEDLVSLRDIAARTGRSYESVRLWAAGQRGGGGFPTPLSTGQWSLYSWAEVASWLGEHDNEYDREIAAADYMLRARSMLAGNEHRAEFVAA